MKQQGFTLVEVLAVITVIGILLAIGGVNYNRWLVKADIERETRELLADLSSLRLQAMHTKQPRRAVLNPNSLVSQSFNTLDDLNAGPPVVASTSTKVLRFPIQDGGGNPFINTITYDSSGVARDAAGNVVNPDPVNNPTPIVIVVTNGQGIDAGVDCIIVDNLQTKVGKFENAQCTPR